MSRRKEPVKLGNYTIDSELKAPPYSSISLWTELALEMKEGDSVFVKDFEEMTKLRGAISRLGFGTRRRMEGEDGYRVWKVKRVKRSEFSKLYSIKKRR